MGSQDRGFIVKRKIYISGPMTGIAGMNFPLFNKVEADLSDQGWDVVNPAKINPDVNADWLDCIVEDIKHMRGCTDIFFLPGYGESDGANIEHIVARRYKMNFHFYDQYYHE